jgi:hypothetical protein
MGKASAALSLAIPLMLVPDAARASLLVADFENGAATNLLGGPTASYGDAYSTIDPPIGGFATGPGYQSTYSAHLRWTLLPGASYPYAEIVTYLLPDEASSGMDLSAYAGVRFYARGSGNYTLGVGTSETSVQYNYYNAPFSVSDAWAQIQVPFASLSQSFGTPEPWDPKTIYVLQWETDARAGDSGELFVDDVEFYLPGEAAPSPAAAIVATPKVNQIGYLPAGAKGFRLVRQICGSAPAPGGGRAYEIARS